MLYDGLENWKIVEVHLRKACFGIWGVSGVSPQWSVVGDGGRSVVGVVGGRSVGWTIIDCRFKKKESQPNE